MESSNGTAEVTFTVLKDRLLSILRRRLNDGEFTERGLARRTNISQPQIHHLLKGERKLSSETADILMSVLQLTMEDLISERDVPARRSAASGA